MGKSYLIKNTTTEERKRIVNEALGVSMLDAKAPTAETKRLMEEYIDGKKEINQILNETIARYKRIGAN